MKKRYRPPFILCILFLFFVTVSLSSCVDQETKYRDSLFKEEEYTIEPTIDFYLIDCLNESNKKAIHLATITFSHINNPKTRWIVGKIKKDHRIIDSELQKLTENNLIIIPKLVYDLNINPDSLTGKNSDCYLLNLLETEIKNQMALFDKIEKTSQNTDFKTFTKQSKKIINTNYDALQTSRSSH